MNGEYVMLQMSDALYSDWNIPKLMLPVLLKDMERMLSPDATEINKDILLDGLVAFLADNPEEKELYAPIISVVAFEAGLDHLREQNGLGMLIASRCFEIAREYDPMNVEVITRQAVASYFTDGKQFAEFMKDALAIAESKNFIEEPLDYLTIAHISYAIGEENLGDSTWYAATDMALAELPPEKYSEFGEKMINICLKENYYTILNRHFTEK